MADAASVLEADISEILREDHPAGGFNEIWSTTDILNMMKVSIRSVSVETLSRDVEADLTMSADRSGVTLPSDCIAVYHAKAQINERVVEIQDFREADLLTGVTNPWHTTSDDQLMASEMYTGQGVRSLRLFPRHTTGTTITILYKAEFPVPATLATGVSISDWFKIPVKYKALADLYKIQSHGFNRKKTEIFESIASVFSNALRSLFQGGQKV